MEKATFIIDIDGVMTTGQFLYSSEGKAYKIFGPHDSDGLKLIKNDANILFISADKRGFEISKKRIDDMGYQIEYVPEGERYDYIMDKFGLGNIFYIGDGLNDVEIIKHCKFGIAPANARAEAKEAAKFVTPSKAAEGAVCDACIEIKKRFFSKFDYKVVILASGTGSRMEEFTKTFNKALIPVEGKPVICHIIDKFPKNIEILVSVGYKKETVVDFIKHNYPDRNITFVEIDKYVGPGTGPGYSLLKCKDYLQCPFIFFSSDTLVREEIPLPDKNWFGLAEVRDTSRFCSAKIENGKVVKIDDKKKTDNNFAFIGLAGVKDHSMFWDALENNPNMISGELQVSNGFSALIGREFFGKIFTWFDTGTKDAYKHTQKNYLHGRGYIGE